jgi:hypothetical protein
MGAVGRPPGLPGELVENRRLKGNIPGTTFALFHVHPNTGSWQPSTPGNNYDSNRYGDTGIADKFNLQMYVVSRAGLGFY